jgi:hypothetical protein
MNLAQATKAKAPTAGNCQGFLSSMTETESRMTSTNSKPKRKGLSKKTRFEVFKRDSFTCQYCGAHPPSVILHVDHILAVANGGANSIDNLITACQPCNLGKGARDLKVTPKKLAEKIAESEEREAQLLGYQELLESKRNRLEEETWKIVDVIMPGSDTVNRDQFNSIYRFIERIGFFEVLDAAEISWSGHVLHKNRFKYFCGVCWNKVRKIDGESE